MAGKIKKEDLFAPNLFPQKEAENYKQALDAIIIANEAIIKTNMELVQNNPKKNSKDILDLARAEKEGSAAIILKTKALQEQEKIRQQEIKTSEALRKQNNALQKDQENLVKQTAKQAKEAANAASVYQKLNKQLIDQKKAVKDLLASGKELSASDKELIKNTQELDKRLKHIDAQVGDNQRNVGGYKEALNDAAAELGTFGGGLTKITRILRLLQEENEGATTKTQKFGNALKFIGVGAVIAGITALIKGFELLKESSGQVADKLETITNVGTSYFLGLFTGNAYQAGAAAFAFTQILQNSRIELRKLSIELETVSNKMEEQNQIASDTTIGFDERNTATKEAIKLSIEKAEKETEIAKLELDNINNDIKRTSISINGGRVSVELLDKQAEQQKKFNTAKAKEDLLTLQNAEKIRQINISQTNEEIDLILKKRESANAQKAIFEEQLKDQKRQLEDRKKISSDLLKYNQDTTNKELELFKKGYGIQFENNKLLAEQDAVLLAQKIKDLRTLEDHGLGEAGIVELSKIVKQSQEDQIANTKTQTALDDELIKRKQKIAEIESQLVIMAVKEQEREAQVAAKLASIGVENTADFILNKGDLFNKKRAEQRKGQIEQEKQSTQEEFDFRAKSIQLQADLDIQNAKDSIYDEKIRAQEIKKIREKLKNDLLANDDDRTAKEYEIYKKNLDATKKIEQEKIKFAIDGSQKILSAVDDGLKQRQEKNNEAIDAEISARERSIEEQQHLAEQGAANTLAFEKEQLAKEQLAKKQLQEKERKQQEAIKLAQMFLSSLNSKIDKGESYLKASGEALAETFAAKGISSIIAGSFFEGSEKVEDDLNPAFSGRDGYLIRADGKERILTGDQNKLIGNMSNDELAKLAHESRLLPDYMMGEIGSFAGNMGNSVMLHQMVAMKNEIRELKNITKDKPTQQVSVDSFANITEIIYKNGEKISQTFMNKNRRKGL